MLSMWIGLCVGQDTSMSRDVTDVGGVTLARVSSQPASPQLCRGW